MPLGTDRCQTSYSPCCSGAAEPHGLWPVAHGMREVAAHSTPKVPPRPLVLGLGCLRGMCFFLLKINMGSGDPIPSPGGFNVACVCSWHVNPTALWGPGEMLCRLLPLVPGPQSPWGCSGAPEPFPEVPRGCWGRGAAPSSWQGLGDAQPSALGTPQHLGRWHGSAAAEGCSKAAAPLSEQLQVLHGPSGARSPIMLTELPFFFPWLGCAVPRSPSPAESTGCEGASAVPPVPAALRPTDFPG